MQTSISLLTFLFNVFKLVMANGHNTTYSLEESNLSAALFNNYNNLVRPSKKVQISLDISLKQITSLDEQNQVITTSSYIFLSWIDERLKWNPYDYNSIENLPVKSKTIWLPDLFVINTAENNGFVTISDSNVVWIQSNGTLFLTIALIGLKTRCEMNSMNFPYDEQNCSIVIGSWQYDMTRIDFVTDTKYDDSVIEYVKNPIWKLLTLNCSIIQTSRRIMPNLNYKQNEIKYSLTLKRLPLYYMMNSIYPCLVLNVVVLLSFALPFALQVTLSMSTFLTLAVYSVRVSSDMPVQSKSFPWISVYFFLGILYTLFALIWFIAANHFATKNYLPNCVSRLAIFFEHYSHLAMYKISDNRTRVKIKTVTVETIQKVDSKLQTLNCNKCELCEECLAIKEKQDEKKRENDYLESCISVLNYLAFLVLFTITFISNLIIWFAVSS